MSETNVLDAVLLFSGHNPVNDMTVSVSYSEPTDLMRSYDKNNVLIFDES